MKVPKDVWECHLCGASPSWLSCEACLETMCSDCSTIIWVLRKRQDWAHLLCKECGIEDS